MKIEDWVAIVIGILSIILGVLAYHYSIRKDVKEVKELKDHLLLLILGTQKSSLQLRTDLINYTNANNAHDKLIFEGITFAKYIKEMETSFELNLSNEVYEKVIKTKYTKANLNSMIASLEKQSEAIEMMQKETNTKLK